ncbi:MAG TPA: TIGR00725 family protein [Thermotogota bacterium]|nr:TIGR00725 family protein [Thermotogota bacterium]HRW34248.1 TIGR00725 family protein [Thermotogota bacterium]
MNICVIGYSGKINKSPVKELYDFTYRLGYTIAVRGHTIWSGGRDGIMDIVSKGAHEGGGEIVGVLPWDKENSLSRPSDYIQNVVYTGLDFTMRSCVLVNNADLVIAVGGGAGTATEIFASYSYGKPLLLCAKSGGWSQRIAETFQGKSGPVYLDSRETAPVFLVHTIDDIERHL